jgi:hypothetical protein
MEPELLEKRRSKSSSILRQRCWAPVGLWRFKVYRLHFIPAIVLSINVADYSNPDMIHDSGALVNFIQDYRIKVRNYDTVVWLTYGDVVEKSSDKMLRFVNTFFTWASSIPTEVAVSMGKIGISFGM